MPNDRFAPLSQEMIEALQRSRRPGFVVPSSSEIRRMVPINGFKEPDISPEAMFNDGWKRALAIAAKEFKRMDPEKFADWISRFEDPDAI